MPYAQTNRPLKVFTPLGDDALLLVGLEGHEALSELFHYELDLLAEKPRAVPFDRLLGESVHAELALPEGGFRHFHGIVVELSQGADDKTFTSYRAVLAPALWRLTKRFGFRIYQDLSVIDVLKKAFAGLDVRFEVADTYRPRYVVVQYHESDFAFVSRLMEQEGIYYYFEHRADGHTMVVTDRPIVHAEIAGQSQVRFDASVSDSIRTDPRVIAWRKTQKLCSGQVTCWDYHFQMPEKHLESTCLVPEPVTAGAVAHHFSAGRNHDLEVFQFTGGYGGHHDALDAAGADQGAVLQQVFDDSKKYARLRMEQEAAQSLRIDGASTCARFLAGQTFTLTGHADADGAYLLTRVTHHVRQSGYRPNEEAAPEYRNELVACPKELRFRPQRQTPWPKAQGLQPAVVVGPPGEEIFTDPFGRVKVQFLWDRDGKHDAHSSCWIRVVQAHAGKGFGFVSLPRVGEEVVVGFAGDNPDRPLIVGRLYNAAHPTPFPLPHDRSVTGLKSHSLTGNARQFSGLAIDDRLGREHLQVHSERDMTQSSEGTLRQWVAGQHQAVVGGSSTRIVGYPKALQQTPAQAAQPATPASTGSTTTTRSSSVLSDAQEICRDADIQFGWVSDGVVGVQSELRVGQHVETTINPVAGLVSLGSAGPEFDDKVMNEGMGVFNRSGSKLGVALASAHTEVTIGSHPQILHGMGLAYTRGPTVEGHKPNASALSKAWGLIYGLVATAVDLLMPIFELKILGTWTPLSSSGDETAAAQATPSIQASNWAQLGEKEAMTQAGRLVLDAMLAVWIGIEMKEQAGHVEAVLVEQEAARVKTATVDASKVEAESLVTEAERKQHKALKAEVRKLLMTHVGVLEEIEELNAAVTKTAEGLYTIAGPSMLLSVTGKMMNKSTLLKLQAMTHVDNPEQKASIVLQANNLVQLQTIEGGAQVLVASGAVPGPIGSVIAQSGREGSLKLKMGDDDPPHAIVLHKDGLKVFSRDGGIHLLHSASAGLADAEAAAAPRKILIESRGAAVEIVGARVVIKAEGTLRLECGANFIELSPAGIVSNKIMELDGTDAACTELASIKLDEA